MAGPRLSQPARILPAASGKLSTDPSLTNNTMNQLARDFDSGLFDDVEGPCLSLYQPTHRPASGRQADAILFKNLVRRLESSLRQQHASRDVAPWLAPFHALADDTSFWRGPLRDGLAVFGAPGLFRVYALQRPMPEVAIAAQSFHVKPLLRVVQSSDNFHVLCIDRDRMRLFEGNRDQLDEVELPEGFPRTSKDVLGEQEHKRFVEAWVPKIQQAGIMHGGGSDRDVVTIALERFFRGVDDAVVEQYSRPSGQPLLLVGLAENLAIYRRVSRNSHLLDVSIDVNPDSLSLEDLRQRAWRKVEPFYLKRLAGLIERFNSAYAHEKADSDVAKVARSAVQGRVDTLLIDADRKVPGRLDPESGSIEHEKLEHPEVDDLLDDIAQQALRSGCEVVVVPSERMPTDTGLAAIYRF